MAAQENHLRTRHRWDAETDAGTESRAWGARAVWYCQMHRCLLLLAAHTQPCITSGGHMRIPRSLTTEVTEYIHASNMRPQQTSTCPSLLAASRLREPPSPSRQRG
eukprot:2988391-Rhodomonas_salina.1